MEHDELQPAEVVRVNLHAGGTRLTLDDGRAVQLGALPDAEGQRRVHRVLRRVTRVDLRIARDSLAAAVLGVGHRRACRVPVSLGTALALAAGGVPTVVAIAAGTPAPEAAEARP